MKKLFLLAALFGTSLTASTFAQEVTTDENLPETTVITTQTWTTVQEQIRANWKEFHENFGNAWLYLKKDLTVDEKNQARNTITARIENIEALNLEIRNLLKNNETVDREAYKAKISEIYEWFKTEFLPFVDEAKTNEFNTFIQERVNTIETNRGLRIENHVADTTIVSERKEAIKAKITEKKQLKTTVKVWAKAEKLRTIVEKIDSTTVLNWLSAKITNLIMKTTNEETKALLNDVNLLIQDKLALLQ